MQALKIRQLKKTYANGFEALKGIDLDLNPGDFLALLGPNGAGKSTTIGIVSNVVKKTSGTVEIFGHSLDSELSKAKSYLGVVPQEINFDPFVKVLQIIVNQAGYYGIPRSVALKRAQFYLEKLGLWEKRDQIARNLSGGMKRRLMIVRALVTEPKLLLLDEPTAGVDVELRRGMWDFLKELNQNGMTIILTTHYLEEAEFLCKHVAIIDHGKILRACPMNELLADVGFETLVLESAHVFGAVPVLEHYTVRLVEPKIIEIDLHPGRSINELFNMLNQQHIQIVSMRNKTNRLEESFMQLIAEPKE